ncbi:MAG TPA: OsmC family protein [Vicinamibacterales bacterium]|nr:OsmC family protein [Vicinamibacterales bacterium]
MTPLPHRYTSELSGGPAGYAKVRTEALPDIRIATPAQYGGPGDAWTPEHLLLAAVQACFLFTFRAVAGAERVNFEYLELWTEGTVDRQDRRTKFTEIILRPRVTIGPEVDRTHIMRLLHKAERACLVSASLDTPIRVEPELVAATCLTLGG